MDRLPHSPGQQRRSWRRRGRVLVTSFVAVMVACSGDFTSPPSETGGATDASFDAPDALGSDEAATTDGPQADGDATSTGEQDSGADVSTVADAALDAGADAALDAADSGDDAHCNALAQHGHPVQMIDVLGSRAANQFSGGTIVDGTYALTAATRYVEPSVVPGTTAVGSETISVAGGVLQEVLDFPAGDAHRFTATLVVAGSALRMTTSCVWTSNPGVRFPELGDWSPLEHEQTGFDATPTKLTIWTPRGNHQSVVRVYEKVVPP